MLPLALLLFGLVVGMLSGMLGIGGGIVLVPGLVLIFGLSQTEAQGTSLAVLMLPVVAFAVMVYYQNGHIQIAKVAVIAAGFLVGAYLGARLLPYVPTAYLRIAFGGLLFYVALTFLLDTKDRPLRAALPAGIALLAAFLWRKLRGKHKPPSIAPNDNSPFDFHI